MQLSAPKACGSTWTATFLPSMSRLLLVGAVAAQAAQQGSAVMISQLPSAPSFGERRFYNFKKSKLLGMQYRTNCSLLAKAQKHANCPWSPHSLLLASIMTHQLAYHIHASVFFLKKQLKNVWVSMRHSQVLRRVSILRARDRIMSCVQRSEMYAAS